MFLQENKLPLAEVWPVCVWRLCSMAIGFETLLVDDKRAHGTCCSFELLLLIALQQKTGQS
jgi:hypothetical protein